MRKFILLSVFVLLFLLGACTHPPSTNTVRAALQEELQGQSFEIVEVGCMQGGALPVKVRIANDATDFSVTELFTIYPDGFGHWKAENKS